MAVISTAAKALVGIVGTGPHLQRPTGTAWSRVLPTKKRLGLGLWLLLHRPSHGHATSLSQKTNKKKHFFPKLPSSQPTHTFFYPGSFLQLFHSIPKTRGIDAARHPTIRTLLRHRPQPWQLWWLSLTHRHQAVAFVEGAPDPRHHPGPRGAVAHDPRQAPLAAPVGVRAMDGVGRVELRLAALDGHPAALAHIQLGLVQGEVEVVKTYGSAAVERTTQKLRNSMSSTHQKIIKDLKSVNWPLSKQPFVDPPESKIKSLGKVLQLSGCSLKVRTSMGPFSWVT